MFSIVYDDFAMFAAGTKALPHGSIQCWTDCSRSRRHVLSWSHDRYAVWGECMCSRDSSLQIDHTMEAMKPRKCNGFNMIICRLRWSKPWITN